MVVAANKLAPAVRQHPEARTTKGYFMASTSLPQPSTRTERGIALYRDRHEEIDRTGPSTYRVPSCSGADSYIVDVRAGFCLCPDHRRAKELGECCKHRTAASIAHAKRAAL